MKKAIVRRMVLMTAAALALFMLSSIAVVSAWGRQTARDNALGQLSIFEKNIIENKLSSEEDFSTLVKLTDGKLRLTVISPDGSVIADTLGGSSSDFDNHSEREEIVEAAKGEIGQDVRRSASVGVNYLYLAKEVSIESGKVLLRVAVPVRSINAYIWPMTGILALILGLVLLGLYFAAPKMTRSVTASIEMIKAKLDTVGKPEDSRITLTPYDEVNRVLLEIDELSEALNDSIINYQNEKENLSFLIENISFAVMAVDSRGKIVLHNCVAREYFDFTENAYIRSSVRSADFLKHLAEVASERKAAAFDLPHGAAGILEVRIIPTGTKTVDLIITAQDVTDRRKLQREKQDFFVNASHELNTPLSSVLGYAEILGNEKKYNEEFVNAIYRQAKRMKSLIGDMLTLAELEEGAVFASDRIDLKEIAEEVLAVYMPRAKNKDIAIEANAEALIIEANREKITEVVSNLVDNAIKYTDGGGEVLVTVKKRGEKAVISVKDNGIGIAQKQLSRIFERFYRTDKGRSRKEGGTGLGLAIVKHICNHYGATLTVNSRENAGTEVVIEFPKAL